MLPTTDNVAIDSYAGREEGSKVTFHCREGFVPVGDMMSTCTGGQWLPLDPNELRCSPGNEFSISISLYVDMYNHIKCS